MEMNAKLVAPVAVVTGCAGDSQWAAGESDRAGWPEGAGEWAHSESIWRAGCGRIISAEQLRQLRHVSSDPPPQILLNLVISWGLVMRTPAQAEKERAIRIYRIEHLLRIRCSFCGAPAGELCRTETGREILSIGLMHLARITPTRVNERYRRFR